MTAVDPETGELVGPASAVQEALAAHGDPAFKVWTEGIEPGIAVFGDGPTSMVLTDRPGGEQALLAVATGQLPVALAVWLGLGPRPIPAHATVRLEPGPMALLIGRREAHGHGLDPDVAADLQERLDAGVRHWTVRVECAAWRRNLEVVEGAGGIWRVRPDGDLVELAPASSTAVLRELVALVGAAAAERRKDRPAAP
jgi:hypothetical protein